MTDVQAGPLAGERALFLSQNPDADALLGASPFALVIGMLLDQQVPMEKAFVGPYVIASRVGEPLEPGVIAAIDPDAFVALVSTPPAVHRFPAAMAAWIQRLAAIIVDQYAGDTEAIWRSGDAYEVRARLQALPGFGEQKAKIFLALLGKQYGVRPDGWREASEPYGAEGSRISVADVADPESLGAVRQAKRAAKLAHREAQAAAQAAAQGESPNEEPTARPTVKAPKARARRS